MMSRHCKVDRFIYRTRKRPPLHPDLPRSLLDTMQGGREGGRGRPKKAPCISTEIENFIIPAFQYMYNIHFIEYHATTVPKYDADNLDLLSSTTATAGTVYARGSLVLSSSLS
jgi:hypothetical protein